MHVIQTISSYLSGFLFVQNTLQMPIIKSLDSQKTAKIETRANPPNSQPQPISLIHLDLIISLDLIEWQDPSDLIHSCNTHSSSDKSYTYPWEFRSEQSVSIILLIRAVPVERVWNAACSQTEVFNKLCLCLKIKLHSIIILINMLMNYFLITYLINQPVYIKTCVRKEFIQKRSPKHANIYIYIKYV